MLPPQLLELGVKSPDAGRIEGGSRAARVGPRCLSPSAERFARANLRGCPSSYESDTRSRRVSRFSLCTLEHLPPQGNPGHSLLTLPESRCRVRLRGLNKLGCRLEQDP